MPKWVVAKITLVNGKEAKGSVTFTEPKDGKVDGSYEFGEEKGTLEGSLKGTILTLKAKDGKEFWIILSEWKPAKIGLGFWKEKNGEKEFSLQIARPEVKLTRPEPSAALLKAVPMKLEIQDGKVTADLNITEVSDGGIVKGTFGKEEIKGAVIGNVITFAFLEGKRRAMIIMAKDGEKWVARTLITEVKK